MQFKEIKHDKPQRDSKYEKRKGKSSNYQNNQAQAPVKPFGQS